MKKRVLRVGLISSYVPKKCGIATYSRDLIEAMNDRGDFDWRVVAAEDPSESHDYGDRALAVIKKDSLESYHVAAKSLNAWRPDVILLEHEYGLYGGEWSDFKKDGIDFHVPTGNYVLELINRLTAPVITTLHTVLTDPGDARRRTINQIDKRTSKFVAMTNDTRDVLGQDYGIKGSHVAVIPHGVPQADKQDRRVILEKLGLREDRFYMLITGLIGPNKGIDVVIRALPKILSKHPQVTLLVVGQTHPDILASAGEAYREGLLRLAEELGVSNALQFVNEYLPTERLVDYFTIADIYLTIHSDPEQSASGTLAYALGCGLAAISTPYRYAREVLADGRGFLVPFNSHEAIVKQANELIENTKLRQQTRKKAMKYGDMMSWPIVAEAYLRLFQEVITEDKVISEYAHDKTATITVL